MSNQSDRGEGYQEPTPITTQNGRQQTPDFNGTKHVAEILPQIPERKVVSDEEAVATERPRPMASRSEMQFRETQFAKLVKKRGSRYEDCRLSNYDAKTDEQRFAVEALRNYCKSMGAMVEDGSGVILFGPKGTGKDHLLMALMRSALLHNGLSLQWHNGTDLYGDWRDSMTTGAWERDEIQRLGGCDVLAISDPLPPVGALSEWEAKMLFRVLDYRYSRCLPTWTTVNVETRKELNDRIGSQLADRLVDGALVIHCNWPSYRKKRG